MPATNPSEWTSPPCPPFQHHLVVLGQSSCCLLCAGQAFLFRIFDTCTIVHSPSKAQQLQLYLAFSNLFFSAFTNWKTMGTSMAPLSTRRLRISLLRGRREANLFRIFLMRHAFEGRGLSVGAKETPSIVTTSSAPSGQFTTQKGALPRHRSALRNSLPAKPRHHVLLHLCLPFSL